MHQTASKTATKREKEKATTVKANTKSPGLYFQDVSCHITQLVENFPKMKTEDVVEPKIIKSNRKKRKSNLTCWVTTTIAEEEFGREALLRATFREFLIYMVSLTLISIYVFGRLSSSKYYLTAALRERLAYEELFEEIELNGYIYTYLKQSLIQDALFKYHEDHDGKRPEEDGMYILNENRVLGVPRMRQVRVTNDSCEIHGYFRRLFLSCYNKFSGASESKDTFGPGVGTAWNYNTPEQTEAMRYWGIKTIYSAGGYYVDFSQNQEESENTLEYLEQNKWITRETRAVFVDFAVYNANLNLFCVCKIIFEMLPTGGVIPSASFKTATIIFGQSSWHFALRGILYVYCLLLLFYVCEEIREIVYFRWKYLMQFWNCVDLIIIFLGFFYVGTVEYIRYQVPRYIEAVEKNPTQYGNFEFIGHLVYFLEIGGAVLIFFVYMKIFKFMNFNRRMAQLNNTLKQCAKDIAGFSVMFFIAYLAYAELGYLVFGSQVKDFSSFGTAMFTLLRTILGDFDYKEIHNANWFVAPIYFLTYMILVFFVLLNMFLAIINDTYVDVKTDIAIAPKELEMTDYLKEKSLNFLRKLGCKVKKESEKEKALHSVINAIEDSLRKCGFSDREIQMYFTRYNIDNLNDLNEDEISRFFDEFSKEENEIKTGKENYVKIGDFVKQEEKLEELENSIVLLTEKVQDLLRYIETTNN